MFFKFGKQQKPRSFDYQPWFYNPEKEEFENRINELKQRYHGEGKEEFKAPTSFDFRNQSSASTKSGRTSRFKTDNYGKVNPMRLILLLAGLGAAAYYFLYMV